MVERDRAIEKEIMTSEMREKIYKSYFETMIIDGLAKLARETLGEEAGFTLVAKIAEEGAYDSFGMVIDSALEKGLDLKGYSLHDILSAIIERLGMGLQAFTEVRRYGRGFEIYTKKCPYLQAAQANPVTCGVCVGLVTGMLRRYGLDVRWIKSPAKKRVLCASSQPPRFVVYKREDVKLPECAIVVEELEC